MSVEQIADQLSFSWHPFHKPLHNLTRLLDGSYVDLVKTGAMYAEWDSPRGPFTYALAMAEEPPLTEDFRLITAYAVLEAYRQKAEKP